MPFSKAKYFLYSSLFFYLVIAVFTLKTLPQGIGWDPGLCIKMADNSYKNIPFNHYAHPNPQNLSEDQEEFVTWWSPGQFAMPLIIQKCFGVKISAALKILTFICLLISGFGIFKLFNQLINDKNNITRCASSTTTLVLIFLLFTTVQPFFWRNLFIYDGGGVLMLAYCPWVIFWVIKFIRINIYSLSLLLVLGIIGFFLKTAFTSIFMGSLLYLFLSESILPHTAVKNQNFKKIVLNGIYLCIVFAVYILIIKVAFLDHNRNIGDSSTGVRIQPRVIFFPFAAPVFGLFSLNFLAKTTWWIIGSVFVLPVYYLMLKSKNITLLYKHVLISFAGACILFYSLLYFINVDVSYETRHYIIIAILITPAFFLSFFRFRIAKYSAVILMTLYSAINVYHFVGDLLETPKAQKSAGDFSGLAFGFPADLIKKIHSLDDLKDKGKDIFYFKSDEPSIALEVRNNRVLLEDNFINFHFINELRFNTTLYFGRNTGQIYLIYPQNQFKKDSATYFTRFEKYKTFEKIYQAKGYSIFKAIASGNN